jgi:hypothetical protein
MNFIPKIEYVDIIDGLPKEFTFDSPPEGDPFNEEVKGSVKVTKSNNGRKQTQFNYIERIYKLEFLFQSEDVKASFEDFFRRHALRGGTFKYYPSSDEVDFNEYTIATRSVAFKRPIPAAIEGTFEYDFSFSIERVDNGI